MKPWISPRICILLGGYYSMQSWNLTYVDSDTERKRKRSKGHWCWEIMSAVCSTSIRYDLTSVYHKVVPACLFMSQYLKCCYWTAKWKNGRVWRSQGIRGRAFSRFKFRQAKCRPKSPVILPCIIYWTNFTLLLWSANIMSDGSHTFIQWLSA